MQITVLIENTSNCSLCAEHGLSVYIEYNGMNYLLDTGASDTFSKNAQELGISLADIDIAFLSHAHYDQRLRRIFQREFESTCLSSGYLC